MAWISCKILSTASSINGATRSSDVIREEHFCRQVGGAQSEWFTAGGCGGGGGGGVHSGGSSSGSSRADGDSILIAEQPEGEESHGWKLWETEEREKWQTHCVLFALRRRCFVDGSEFAEGVEGATGGGVCRSEIEVQQRQRSKWEANTREMDRQTALPDSSALCVD